MVVLTWVLFAGCVVLIVPVVWAILKGVVNELRSDYEPQVRDEEEMRRRLDRNTDWDND